MKSISVSVTEGKKGFSRLIRDALEKKVEIVVTERGRPVAVILPYEEYQHSKRIEGYKKIWEARQVFLKTNILANEVFKESRRQLEKKRGRIKDEKLLTAIEGFKGMILFDREDFLKNNLEQIEKKFSRGHRTCNQRSF